MKNQPAVFLKLLVLLVPREMEVTHSGGLKALSDEELERGIEMITAMLAARETGSQAKVIEGVTENLETPTLETSEPRPRPTRRKAQRDMGQDMGSEGDSVNS